jgi:hypothetical protein
MDALSTDFWALTAHDIVKKRVTIITYKKYLIFISFCGTK